MKHPKRRMGEKRKRLCSILSAFILCVAVAATARLLYTPVTRAEQPEPPKARLLYIDPGHGGFDLGAVGSLPDGGRLPEKELVLAIALSVSDRLRSEGCTLQLSRTGDERLTYLTAADEVRARRAAAEQAEVDLLLSIHANAYAGEGRAYGPRVYYHPDSEPSRRAAEAIAAAITQHTGAIIGRECRVVADDSYYLLANPELPAVLIEVGFLSDATECALLATPAYREALCEAICAGAMQ